ncbi:hypothetical protein FJT64_013639 [Amphibalanus amphitrite]|uniref:DNA-binding protein HEXBP n=1 Tax=Amphibalanus amphitrite TaxID=1232801 RepID=A0A6A4V259_AMPAM|nr:hypothetical protein FJT64_013639 [Amphibalanus amphitrite]
MVEGELFDAFLSRLRLAAARCQFPPEQVSAALRDQAIAGCTPRLQERVLQRAVEAQEPLSLQDVVNIVHNVERTDRLLREVRQDGQLAVPQEGQQVQALGQPSRGEQRCSQCGELGHWRDHCPSAQSQQAGARPRQAGARPRRAGAPRCYRCGERGHLRRDCSKRRAVKLIQDSDQADWQVCAVHLAAGAAQKSGFFRQPGSANGGRLDSRRGGPRRRGETRRCFRCGDSGHLKRDCPGCGQVTSVDAVTSVAQRRTQRQDRLPLVAVTVNGRPTEMMADTGSPVSIVADGSIPGLKLRPSTVQLRSFTGQTVPVRGEATVEVEFGGQRRRLNVVVSDRLGHQPLIGRDWLRDMRLDWRSLLQGSEDREVSGADGVRGRRDTKGAGGRRDADAAGAGGRQDADGAGGRRDADGAGGRRDADGAGGRRGAGGGSGHRYAGGSSGRRDVGGGGGAGRPVGDARARSFGGGDGIGSVRAATVGDVRRAGFSDEYTGGGAKRPVGDDRADGRGDGGRAGSASDLIGGCTSGVDLSGGRVGAGDSGGDLSGALGDGGGGDVSHADNLGDGQAGDPSGGDGQASDLGGAGCAGGLSGALGDRGGGGASDAGDPGGGGGGCAGEVSAVGPLERERGAHTGRSAVPFRPASEAPGAAYRRLIADI